MKDIKKLRAEMQEAGYAVMKYDDAPVHSYPYDTPWLDDENFNEIYQVIRNNTLVDRTRCYGLYQIMQQVIETDGDILEIGTWRGGTAGIFTKLAQNKTVYLADTFTGVVKSSEWEHYEDKAHSDTTEELVVNFLKNDLNVHNFEILKGIFPEDTGGQIAHKTFSLVHIDVDVYQSAKDSFEYVWDQVTPGGIVVFDDYGFISACSGVYKFVNEVKKNEDNVFIHNINGHAYIIKK